VRFIFYFLFFVFYFLFFIFSYYRYVHEVHVRNLLAGQGSDTTPASRTSARLFPVNSEIIYQTKYD
jgi:hypothetical protein